MAVNLREWWTQKRKDLAIPKNATTMPAFFIPSAVESKGNKGDEERKVIQAVVDDRVARAKHCTDVGVRAGFKAAGIACIASAIPTLAAVRMIPWVKANVNYTGQALIISSATIASYFIVTEQTILECSRDAANERRRPAVS